MNLLCYFCLVLSCFRVRLYIDALWSPAGKWLTSRLSFVMYNCEVVTFPLVFYSQSGSAHNHYEATLYRGKLPFVSSMLSVLGS